MHLAAIGRILGMLLMVFSCSMLTPLLVEWSFMQPIAKPFYLSFGITFGVGAWLWLLFRNSLANISVHDAFIIVVLFWIVLSGFASLPFWLSDNNFSLLDSLFEALSGLTTTGASIIVDLQLLSKQLLYYRQQLHFLGGMGIIVLAVAILPVLGVGGMQLYYLEMPGPIKENRLTPRIKETAKSFWLIYLGMTLLCIGLYWLFGMELLDAIGEGFSTVATGGFTMHASSFKYYDSQAIELIAIIFMLLSATNYASHYLAITRNSINMYWQDYELQQYILWILFLIFIVLLGLELTNEYAELSLVRKIFPVVSLATTSGLIVENFSKWPSFIPIVIMLAAVVGGCAGSTAGGIKIIRWLVLRNQIKRELRRLLHPRGVFIIKLGQQVVRRPVLQAVSGFVAAFIGVLMILILILLSQGLDLFTAFGASIASLCNAGAGIGAVADNYAQLTDISKCSLMFAMLAGRLEIFTVIILFTPIFWKQ